MTIQNFGRKVKVEIVKSSNRSPVFTTEELRVDFEIRVLQGYNRAKIDIYNLNDETVSALAGADLYLRVYVAEHDNPYELLAGEFYVNNTITERKLPNQVTSLYCVGSLQKDFTDKEVSLVTKSTSLTGVLNLLDRKVSGDAKFKLIGFPDTVAEWKPVRNKSYYTGSVKSVLTKLSKQYGFSFREEGKVMYIEYIPNSNNAAQIDWSTRDKVILDNAEMKANVSVGVASLDVLSNLNARIKPTVILDTSALITAGTALGFAQLTQTKEFLKNSVSGSPLFSVLTVVHKGSTHTKKWETAANAYKVSAGTNIKTYNWFGGE